MKIVSNACNSESNRKCYVVKLKSGVLYAGNNWINGKTSGLGDAYSQFDVALFRKSLKVLNSHELYK